MGRIETPQSVDFDQIRLDTLKREFKSGMRAKNLESQPTRWVSEGLKLMEEREKEEGEEVTVEDLREIDRRA